MKVWISNAIWIHRLVCWCNSWVYAQADENQRVIACIGDGSFQVIISSYKPSIICDSYMVHKNLGPNWYLLHFNYKCALGHTIWTWRTGSNEKLKALRFLWRRRIKKLFATVIYINPTKKNASDQISFVSSF